MPARRKPASTTTLCAVATTKYACPLLCISLVVVLVLVLVPFTCRVCARAVHSERRLIGNCASQDRREGAAREQRAARSLHAALRRFVRRVSNSPTRFLLLYCIQMKEKVQFSHRIARLIRAQYVCGSINCSLGTERSFGLLINLT